MIPFFNLMLFIKIGKPTIISSMEEVRTKDKIGITKDIIRNLDLYLFYDGNDSIRIPLDKNALFSFYLYDKSMKNVFIEY